VLTFVTLVEKIYESLKQFLRMELISEFAITFILFPLCIEKKGVDYNPN